MVWSPAVANMAATLEPFTGWIPHGGVGEANPAAVMGANPAGSTPAEASRAVNTEVAAREEQDRARRG